MLLHGGNIPPLTTQKSSEICLLFLVPCKFGTLTTRIAGNHCQHQFSLSKWCYNTMDDRAFSIDLHRSTALVRAFSDDLQDEVHEDGPHRTLAKSLSWKVQSDREKEQRLARLSLEWPLLFADVSHLSEMYVHMEIPHLYFCIVDTFTASLNLGRSSFYGVVQRLRKPGKSSKYRCRKIKGLRYTTRHLRSPYFPASSSRPLPNGKQNGMKVHGAS